MINSIKDLGISKLIPVNVGDKIYWMGPGNNITVYTVTKIKLTVSVSPKYGEYYNYTVDTVDTENDEGTTFEKKNYNITWFSSKEDLLSSVIKNLSKLS